jgi:MFS family permease
MLRTAPGWLKALLIGQLVSAAGSLAWLYLTLWLVSDRHLATGSAGLVTATYGAGAIAGNLFGGSVGDRFGMRSALATTKGVALLTCIAFPICPTTGLAPLALVTGLAGGMGRPLMSAIVATGMPTEVRREAVAWSRAAFNAGTVIGPPLGGLLAVHHFGWVFVIDGLTSAVLLVVVLCAVPRHVVPRVKVPHGLLGVLRTDGSIRTLVLSVLTVDTTYRLLYTAVPLFLVARHAPAWVYGATISLNGLGIVLLEPRVARRLSGRPATRVISAGYALVGAGWLLLALVPTVAGAFLTVLVITAGEMLYKPTATAHAADLAPAGMAGRYQSLYASASIGGMVLSPLLGTTLYGVAPALLWPTAAVTALVAARWVGGPGVWSAGQRVPLRAPTSIEGSGLMSDAAKGATEEAKGHLKRPTGKVLDDEDLAREGSAQVHKGREERRAAQHEAKAELHEAEERAAQRAK